MALEIAEIVIDINTVFILTNLALTAGILYLLLTHHTWAKEKKYKR